jgi:hypothetical protein
MLQALASGEHDPAALAAWAEPELQATPEELMDALAAHQPLGISKIALRPRGARLE